MEGRWRKIKGGKKEMNTNRQAILVALQTGKTTRNSVSETHPFLSEDGVPIAFALGSLTRKVGGGGGESRPSIDGAKFFSTSFSTVF